MGRITDQKMPCCKRLAVERWALEPLLEVLGKRGVLLLLGSGDGRQQFLTTIAGRCSTLFFCAAIPIRWRRPNMPTVIYPDASLFEPCGNEIRCSAMRASQPCLAHQLRAAE